MASGNTVDKNRVKVVAAVGFSPQSSTPLSGAGNVPFLYHNSGDDSLRYVNDAGTEVSLSTSGSAGSALRARASTTAALAAGTYANGTAGVGATFTASANGALAAQDGVTLVAGEILLVKDQASGLQNGVYTVTQVGTGSLPFILTRIPEFDSAAEIKDGVMVAVGEGTANADTVWRMTVNGAVVVGTTAITFAREAGVALTGSANTFTAANVFAGLSQSGASTFATGTGAVSINGATTIAANINVSSAAGTGAVDFSLGTGLFKSTTGENTLGGNVTIAAGKNLTMAAGAGAVNLVAATGKFAPPTIVNDQLGPGCPVIHKFIIPAGATGNVDFVLTDKIEINDVHLVKTTAAGGGAGTIQVQTGAGAAITDAMSINVADETVVRCATVNDANFTIAAAGTLRFARTRTASTDESCIAYVKGILRA